MRREQAFKQRVMTGVIAGAVVGALVTLNGCSGTAIYNGQAYRFDSGDTDREMVVDATRQVLADHRFVIDRVDGRRGVVTTEFKSTQGIASPWDGEQGSLRDESADFVNQHERSIRVLINDDGSVDVSVVVQRVHRPGWRIETESISSSTHTTVIGTDGRAQPRRLVTPVGIDGQLARRIGEEIDHAINERLALIAQATED